MTTLATRGQARARTAAAGGDTRLYDLVALGLAVYARTRFRIRVLGGPLTLAPGTLLVSTHRSDDDVPLLVGSLYRQAHGLVRRGPPVHFAVRDDLFIAGFFAGFPPGVPRLLRRILFGLTIGPVLRRLLPCHPVRSGVRMRIVELLRDSPQEALDALLPPELLEPLLARAAEFRREARLARDLLDGDYADLLWRVVDAGEVPSPAAEPTWRARRADATGDFHELVAVVRAGGSLFICPEGRPSPDGEIGPLMGGVASLVRRAEPVALLPLAPAYDPLVEGRRPLALVGVGPPVEPPAGADAVLALLRRTSPLTVGSSLAAALADGDDPEARLAADVEAARAEGRPYEPELERREARRARLAVARGLAAGCDLTRLEREYRSARS